MTYDVPALRRRARERAQWRAAAPWPFAGEIREGAVGHVGVRIYEPTRRITGRCVVFAHGGYGLLGDLNLQDNWCRMVGENLRSIVISVDYRLAPEWRFADAVDDVRRVADDQLRQGQDVLLAGDSAGGAVVVSAALQNAPSALLLTNPNLDMTLESLDPQRGAEPDAGLADFSFRHWLRDDTPLRLERQGDRLPPTCVVVGTNAPLLPEACSLVGDGSRHRICQLPGVGHGFVSDPHHASAAADWFAGQLGLR